MLLISDIGLITVEGTLDLAAARASIASEAAKRNPDAANEELAKAPMNSTGKIS